MTLRRSLALAVALVALLATGTVAAAETTASHHRPPRAVLQLTITAEVGAAATARLTCQPTGGNHPKANAACAELGRAGGNLDKLPNRGLLCTMEYAPVTAAAHGHWRGKAVAWQKVFSNRCVLNSATGMVFEF